MGTTRIGDQKPPSKLKVDTNCREGNKRASQATAMEDHSTYQCSKGSTRPSKDDEQTLRCRTTLQSNLAEPFGPGLIHPSLQWTKQCLEMKLNEISPESLIG